MPRVGFEHKGEDGSAVDSLLTLIGFLEKWTEYLNIIYMILIL
jgi:hypothetical protein